MERGVDCGVDESSKPVQAIDFIALIERICRVDGG
jgi:hypothetical protein